MSIASADLSWLPVDAAWDTRFAALKTIADPDAAWRAFVALAGTRIDAIRTNRLDRAYQARFAAAPPPGLATRPVRLALLSSSTVSHLLPGLRIGALRRGLWLTTYVSDYGQYFRDLADPGSKLSCFAPTEILFSFDAPHLTRGLDPLADAPAVAALHDAVLAHLADCWRLGMSRFGIRALQQAALPIFPPLLGNNEHRLAGSPQRFVVKLNEAIRASDVDLIAVDAACARDGLAAWSQPALWLKAKQEIAFAATPLYGDLVARVLAARQGRAFKCLVLDLDNTLWGGVIGDDGLNGIVIGQGSASGESFLALQRYAKDLSGRGIILAVCSKNDAANAKLPFTDHPDMILRLADFSAFEANWDDKARNIRRIAQTLNIGLDAIVFVDDNPFERELVRAELPMVAVPEVPDDAMLVATCLADAGYFESLGLTADDRQRAAQYGANAERASFAAETSDVEGYLRGLAMRLIHRAFDADGLARVTQLVNKTNQFNLTTRRYGEPEVAAVMVAEDQFGLQLRLLDRFGDNGMIAVVIGRQVAEDVHLDTWLMSCRVLGRHVEQATLRVVVEEAKRRGATRLIGLFKPTAKNAMVRDHYATLGFTRDGDDVDGLAGATRWVLDLEAWTPHDVFMAVERG